MVGALMVGLPGGLGVDGNDGGITFGGGKDASQAMGGRTHLCWLRFVCCLGSSLAGCQAGCLLFADYGGDHNEPSDRHSGTIDEEN
jgi:hypothetical protein